MLAVPARWPNYEVMAEIHAGVPRRSRAARLPCNPHFCSLGNAQPQGQIGANQSLQRTV